MEQKIIILLLLIFVVIGVSIIFICISRKDKYITKINNPIPKCVMGIVDTGIEKLFNSTLITDLPNLIKSIPKGIDINYKIADNKTSGPAWANYNINLKNLDNIGIHNITPTITCYKGPPPLHIKNPTRIQCNVLLNITGTLNITIDGSAGFLSISVSENLTGSADFSASLNLDLDILLDLPSANTCGRISKIYSFNIALQNPTSWDVKNIVIEKSTSSSQICNQIGSVVCDVTCNTYPGVPCYSGGDGKRPYWNCNAEKASCESGCCGPIHFCDCNKCRLDYKKCFDACDADVAVCKQECINNCESTLNSLLGGIFTDVKDILSQNVIKTYALPPLFSELNSLFPQLLTSLKFCL